MPKLINQEAVLRDIYNTIESSGCANHESEIIDCVKYAEPVQQWVSVQDHLPDKDGFYLVFDADRSIIDVYSCYFDTNIGDNGEFGFENSVYDQYTLGFVETQWTSNEAVTHWMHLPELPQMEDA